MNLDHRAVEGTAVAGLDTAADIAGVDTVVDIVAEDIAVDRDIVEVLGLVLVQLRLLAQGLRQQVRRQRVRRQQEQQVVE